jgi:sphingolipid delta-4 desaturase
VPTLEKSAAAHTAGVKPGFKWGMLGSSAPVFPGFEVDILDRVPDQEREDAVWHRERSRAILKAHPEVRALFGHSVWSALPCVGVAAAQIGIAVAVTYAPWWSAIIAAYFVGALLNIALFQLAHECDHHLVFKKASWNRYLFTLTSLPMGLSGHHTWWVEHIAHHNDMGAKKDFISRRRSFFLLTRLRIFWFESGFIYKAFGWLSSPMFFPYALFNIFFQTIRTTLGTVLYLVTDLPRGRLKPSDFTLAVLADEHLVSGYKKEGIEFWAVTYSVLHLVMIVTLVLTVGWVSILYLALSQIFFTGFLQPYCMGWVLGISHFHGTRHYQPTASHYGKLVNLTSFNAGLHVEHHDLAAIPWFRLWKLRRIAADYYDDLETIKSYSVLSWEFAFSNAEHFEENFSSEERRNRKRFAEPATEA